MFDLGEVGLGTYDPELNALLKEAQRTRTSILQLIAGCVWIYADAAKNASFIDAKRNFRRRLIEKEPELEHTLSTRHARWDKDRLISVNSGFFHPVSKPLYLRDLDPEIVAAVTCGELMHKVYLYIDWARFSRIVDEAGAQFTWASGKQARRAQAMKPELRPPDNQRRGFPRSLWAAQPPHCRTRVWCKSSLMGELRAPWWTRSITIIDAKSGGAH